jgi:uncharacterized phage protein (TIGR02218 family)
MARWFQDDLTTLAFCWRMARRDGVTLGFTTHDSNLEMDGLIYRAAPGMVPSAIERSSGFDLDTVDLGGALTSDALREDDLLTGRWDGALLKLFAVNWRAPMGDPLCLLRGSLGNVTLSDGRFSVELRGPVAQFEEPVVEATSPDCRATLGDKRCRVDMAGRTVQARVLLVENATVTLSESYADQVFARGELRWIDGDNAGLGATIITHVGNRLTLSEPPFRPLVAGSRVALIQGCDRQFATCKNRFANALNFRGEPHLPGNDLLTRYAS